MRIKIELFCTYTLCVLLITSFKSIAQSNRIDSLKKVIQTEKDDSSKVITLGHISAYYWMTGDYENEMQAAKAVLELATRLNYTAGMADGNLFIGLAYSLKNEHTNVDEYFEKALALYKKTGIRQKIIDCYGGMAEAYGRNNDQTKAFECIYAAQKIREETGDKKTIADGYVDIASIFYNTSSNNIEEQRKYELAALKIYQEIHDQNGIGTCYFMLGGDDSEEKKYAEALEKYNQALQILKDSGRLNYIANIYSLIGQVYKILGDSAHNAGNKILATDRYLEAEKNQLISLKKWLAVPYMLSVGNCYYDLGFLNISLQNLNMAKKYLDSGLTTYQSLGLKKAVGDIYVGYAKIDSIRGDYKNAYNHYKLYKMYSDSSINEEDAKKAVRVQMQYDFDKKEVAAAAVQDKKDADTQRSRNKQYFIIAALGIMVLAVIIIAFNQFRYSTQKQKANRLLRDQKEEIEHQKEKAETALSELKSTQVQLIQSEKMASLGELTAGIAHEIQNPLNFVNNFSEVNQELIDEAGDAMDSGNLNEAKELLSSLRENQTKINFHGRRADAIVKGMLQHSRTSTGQKEPTNINILADEYLHIAYHGLRAKDRTFNATMKTDLDPNIGTVPIVPQDIGRVLLNLYNNAFYSVSEKKKRISSGYEPTVHLTTRKANGKVEISVRDNGIGIPQKVYDKIFQPFFTTKPTGEGTGLGLSLSYDSVKAHGGEIHATTKEGEYAEFVVALPA
jgi:signal transduction histidine kinase